MACAQNARSHDLSAASDPTFDVNDYQAVSMSYNSAMEQSRRQQALKRVDIKVRNYIDDQPGSASISLGFR
jgi:hypothetical protein